MSGRFVCLLVIMTVVTYSQALGQDPATAPQFRSRSEYLAERRKVETAFPDLVRALRTLHLPLDKMSQVDAKLRRSEVETRAAREELKSLIEKRQDYNRRFNDSARIAELRTSLQTSTDQLHSEIEALLTQQQRDQFDKQLRRPTHERRTKPTNSR